MSYHQFHHLIIAFILAALRLTGAFIVCPALTDAMIMGTARRVAILSFATFLVPLIQHIMPEEDIPMTLLGLTAFKELMIGLLIGFFAAIPFWVAENVGNFIDNQRGATMGEVYSPLSGTQVSSTGIFFTQLVSTVFFISGAFMLLLSAIYKSYEVFPVFGELRLATDAPVQILGHLDGMIKTMFIISAPVIILMFLATIGLGFVNRTAPQLNVFFLSMPVKSALGIAMLIIYLPFIMDMLMYTRDSQILNPVIKLLK